MARTMTVVALKALRYGSRHIEAGESFEVRERDGRTLIAIRKASRAPGELGTVVAAAPVEVEAPVEAPSEDRPSGKRRRYARRDVQAED